MSLFLSSVPLGWPTYALLGVGILLLFVDILVWLWQQRKTGEKSDKGDEDESKKPTPPGPKPPTPGTPLSPDALRDRYLANLIADCCCARLVGLDSQAADPTHGGLSMEWLYVPPPIV